MKIPSATSTTKDCANGSDPPPVSCCTAITLLAVLVVDLASVVVCLTVLASRVDIIASCVVSNKPLAS